jgi:hypothetical protein
MRLRWLDLPVDQMEATEIGARRHLEGLRHADAVSRFDGEMSEVFAALRRVMRPGARAVVVIADSVVAGKPVWADPLVRRCAERAGLAWLATGSQLRPHFHGKSQRAFEGQPRKEHTIVLHRPDGP